jgi:sugar lactone lactonase YvrE
VNRDTSAFHAVFAAISLLPWSLEVHAPQLPSPTPSDPFPYVLVPHDAIRGFLLEGLFVEPTALCFDPEAHELIVADTKSAVIGIFDEDGVPLFAFGGHSVLSDPKQVQVDRDGTIYVLDSESTSIKVFSYRGEPRPPLLLGHPALGESPARIVHASAFAVDRRGELYIVDGQSPEVLVYDRHEGLKRVLQSAPGAATLESPCALSVAVDGRIAVLDAKGRPVQILDADGHLLVAFGKRDLGIENFTSPVSVRFDDQGLLYVVDMLRHEVKVFDGTGRILHQFGGWFSPATRGHGPGEMLYPSDVAIAPGGRVFVAERFGARVQLFERAPRPANERAPSALRAR